MEREKRVYGLIGYPVKHSLSPAMHNAAFGALKINAEYKLFEVKPAELEDFLEKLFQDYSIKDVNGDCIPTKDIFGFNITIPHKVKAREILEKRNPFDRNAKEMDQLLHYVKVSGAVNTFKKNGNMLEGYWNTDVEGFMKSMKEDLKFDKQNKNILLLGCGGAGRAIIAGLSYRESNEKGINKIYVNDISEIAFDSVKDELSKISEYYKNFAENKMQFVSMGEIREIIKNCNLLVNATPIGMKENDPSVIRKELFHDGLSVYDIVYNRETQLIQDAKSLGLNARNGLGMLLYQGMVSFKKWTNKDAPQDIMWKALCSQIH